MNMKTRNRKLAITSHHISFAHTIGILIHGARALQSQRSTIQCYILRSPINRVNFSRFMSPS